MARGGSKLWVPGRLFARFFADTRAQSSLKRTMRSMILISQDLKSSQPAHLLGTKMKSKLFSSTKQNHTAMVSLRYIYDEIIGLSYSFQVSDKGKGWQVLL